MAPDQPGDPSRHDQALDQVLEALANPHRRAMVHLLGLQPWAVSRLAQERGLSLPAIHKHLKILEEAKLVSRHKSGRTTYLRLSRQPLFLLKGWVDQFHLHWGSDQATYENYARHLGLDAADELTRPTAPTGESE